MSLLQVELVARRQEISRQRVFLVVGSALHLFAVYVVLGLDHGLKLLLLRLMLFVLEVPVQSLSHLACVVQDGVAHVTALLVPRGRLMFLHIL